MNSKNKFLISILFVIAMAAVMLFTESKSEGEQGIIIKLELAPNIHAVEQLVSKFDDEHIQWLRLNTQLDFIFLLTYTSLFVFALKGLWERLYKTNPSALLLGFAFIPGVLDIVENFFILSFLNRDFSTSYFNIYYWCVHAKWVLVGAFVILSLIQLGWIIYGKWFQADVKAH